MNPINPLPAIAALFLAFFTAKLLTRRFGAPPPLGRYASIDGLRGYLAFFVFLHHSSVWYFYLQTGQWGDPPSALFAYLGKASVAFFFMITGFLFLGKVIDERKNEIDWLRLYVSRVMRLTPLYLFVLVLVLVVVAILSRGLLREPPLNVLTEIGKWAGFTIFGMPDINSVDGTRLIVAGVTWSLPYEWFFYLALPLMAVLVGARPPLAYVLLSAAALVAVLVYCDRLASLALFGGGAAAAFLVRVSLIRRWCSTWPMSIVAIGSMVCAVWLFPDPHRAIPMAFVSLTFTIIACGNTLFGVLTRAASRTLGEMAYSIYLLHGITLYVILTFIIGLPQAKLMTPLGFWAVIMAVSPVVALISFFTFRHIEHPAMRSGGKMTAWLRSSARRYFVTESTKRT